MKLIIKQVSEFSQNDLLDPNQSSLKTSCSTEMVLLPVIKVLKSSRAAAQSSVLIILDPSAAFDTVNHKILFSILSDIGISVQILPLWVFQGIVVASNISNPSAAHQCPPRLRTGTPILFILHLCGLDYPPWA